jgi:hypothetical protein
LHLQKQVPTSPAPHKNDSKQIMRGGRPFLKWIIWEEKEMAINII